MPCYLITYHAYLSWMPDRRRGYVERKKGILPPDAERARQYRDNAKEAEVVFSLPIQRLILGEAYTACGHQRLRLHAVAFDPSHAHILVSWRDARRVKAVRSNLKSSLTRRLNRELDRRSWFADNAGRRRVRDRKHFDYLVNVYLPGHRGLFWREGAPPPELPPESPESAGC